MLLSAVVCLASLVGSLSLVISFLHWADRRERQWARERTALLNHIQYGERLPTSLEDWPVRPEREPDQIGLVGRIDDSEPQ